MEHRMASTEKYSGSKFYKINMAAYLMGYLTFIKQYFSIKTNALHCFNLDLIDGQGRYHSTHLNSLDRTANEIIPIELIILLNVLLSSLNTA